MDKKKIVFVTQQLGCGGVEKALANFMKLIDREKYICELMVISKEGEFSDIYPEDIIITEYNCPKYIKDIAAHYYTSPVISRDDSINVKLSKKIWKIIVLINKVTVRLFKKNIIFFFIFNKYKKNNNIQCDMIVDYHGYGAYTTYLVANSKNIKRRVSWIHEQTIYNAYKCIGNCYKKFNKIFGVSKECCDNFANVFKDCAGNVEPLYNYLDIEDIKIKAKEKIEDNLFSDEVINIVSVGRVSEQKKFERVIETAKILKSKNIGFRWVVVGAGEQFELLTQKCIEEKVDDCVKFIGFRSNPYAYIARAGLYVQTSLVEGLCTTISEAIILGKPIVSTKVSGLLEQLDNGRGGMIAEHSPESIAMCIEILILDDNRRILMQKYNQNKNMNYLKEVEKLYRIL